jgi:hypothetical protein
MAEVIYLCCMFAMVLFVLFYLFWPKRQDRKSIGQMVAGEFKLLRTLLIGLLNGRSRG